jgi:hypothetical protein
MCCLCVRGCRIDPRSLYGLNELRGLQLEENGWLLVASSLIPCTRRSSFLSSFRGCCPAGLRTLVNLGVLPKLRSLFLAHNRLSEIQELGKFSPSPLFLSGPRAACRSTWLGAGLPGAACVVADNLFVDRCPSLIEISLK